MRTFEKQGSSNPSLACHCNRIRREYSYHNKSISGAISSVMLMLPQGASCNQQRCRIRRRIYEQLSRPCTPPYDGNGYSNQDDTSHCSSSTNKLAQCGGDVNVACKKHASGTGKQWTEDNGVKDWQTEGVVLWLGHLPISTEGCVATPVGALGNGGPTLNCAHTCSCFNASKR